jgi:hypothetical protein
MRVVDMCGFCYNERWDVGPARCVEKPEELAGPIGQYHCPDCGSMVLAGMPHPALCEEHQPPTTTPEPENT